MSEAPAATISLFARSATRWTVWDDSCPQDHCFFNQSASKEGFGAVAAWCYSKLSAFVGFLLFFCRKEVPSPPWLVQVGCGLQKGHTCIDLLMKGWQLWSMILATSKSMLLLVLAWCFASPHKHHKHNSVFSLVPKHTSSNPCLHNSNPMPITRILKQPKQQ